MYSSLLKVDIVADTATGPLFVQTDHRTATEMADEAEITTLFGLTRVINARRVATENGKPATIVYACMDKPSPALVEVLAATGAELEVDGGQQRKKLAPVSATPAELADGAFGQLAKRVKARIGLTDWAAVLHALEAETLADGLDCEEDEIGYWTRILELAAVTGEVLRARHGGRWVECDRADVPFGFERTSKTGGAESMITLPTNRAARFIADGEGETMFHLLETDGEAIARENGPILPSLRKRSDALREKMLFRPLLERATDADVPVIAYGTDGERTFGIITNERSEDPEKLHEAALVNITKQQVKAERIDIAGVDVVVVSDSFFATEKLLDRAFMQRLHRDLGEMLAVATPCRGLMFVTNAASPDPVRAMTLLRAIIEKESQTTRSIASAILLVQNGEVVGHVQLTSKDETPEPPPPKKKPGFFRRLFGGGQA